jgi:septum formation protein
VYERLVQQDDRDPPDLVISGKLAVSPVLRKANSPADTVVIYPPTSASSSSTTYPADQRPTATASAEDDGPPATDEDLCEILEKPISKDDQLRMLQNMSGSDCEIVTGVSIGELSAAAS